MTLPWLFDQITSAAGGFVFGLLTAFWFHAMWLRWHPHRVRFWGAWYTDGRLLAVFGVALLVGWVAFLLKSLV